MVYPNEAFYVVAGLGLGNKETGNYGLSIGLKPELAKKFYERELTREEVRRMDREGKGIIKDFFDFESDIDPYHFVNNEKGNRTLLLQFCRTIGNACDLGIDGMELSDLERLFDPKFLVEYGPHNVDSRMQALSLFTLWNQWAVKAYATTR